MIRGQVTEVGGLMTRHQEMPGTYSWYAYPGSEIARGPGIHRCASDNAASAILPITQLKLG